MARFSAAIDGSLIQSCRRVTPSSWRFCDLGADGGQGVLAPSARRGRARAAADVAVAPRKLAAGGFWTCGEV